MQCPPGVILLACSVTRTLVTIQTTVPLSARVCFALYWSDISCGALTVIKTPSPCTKHASVGL